VGCFTGCAHASSFGDEKSLCTGTVSQFPVMTSSGR